MLTFCKMRSTNGKCTYSESFCRWGDCLNVCAFRMKQLGGVFRDRWSCEGVIVRVAVLSEARHNACCAILKRKFPHKEGCARAELQTAQGEGVDVWHASRTQSCVVRNVTRGTPGGLVIALCHVQYNSRVAALCNVQSYSLLTVSYCMARHVWPILMGSMTLNISTKSYSLAVDQLYCILPHRHPTPSRRHEPHWSPTTSHRNINQPVSPPPSPSSPPLHPSSASSPGPSVPKSPLFNLPLPPPPPPRIHRNPHNCHNPHPM